MREGGGVGLHCFGLGGEDLGDVLVEVFCVGVVELQELVVGRVVLDGGDQLEVLQHGGGDHVVEGDVLREQHHAVLEKTTTDHLSVHLPQEDYLKLAICAVLYQDPF